MDFMSPSIRFCSYLAKNSKIFHWAISLRSFFYKTGIPELKFSESWDWQSVPGLQSLTLTAGVPQRPPAAARGAVWRLSPASSTEDGLQEVGMRLPVHSAVVRPGPPAQGDLSPLEFWSVCLAEPRRSSRPPWRSDRQRGVVHKDSEEQAKEGRRAWACTAGTRCTGHRGVKAIE